MIELKRGEFKPEHAGKMNSYCSVVDEKLQHSTEAYHRFDFMPDQRPDTGRIYLARYSKANWSFGLRVNLYIARGLKIQLTKHRGCRKQNAVIMGSNQYTAEEML